MDKKLFIGELFELKFQISKSQVIDFGNATGDFNPIHFDEEFAKSTIFEKPILHGFHGASIFSKIFGTIWPGEGTIYLKQDLKFLKPMYSDVTYTASLLVKHIDDKKHRALIETKVIHEDHPAIIGEALILNSRKI